MDPQPLTAALPPLLGWAAHGTVLARRLHTARRDPLTGLHTRAGWSARAERVIRRPAAAVLLIDLDGFKTLNDTHGHPAGDAALTATAARLATWCGRHGTAGRLGGDEFAAAVTDLDATPGLDALRAALNSPVEHAGHRVPVSASLGACHPHDLPVLALTDALSAADRAMYADKGHTRRNR
jgi:diguanylate cyclase (GGDEF)-like protein